MNTIDQITSGLKRWAKELPDNQREYLLLASDEEEYFHAGISAGGYKGIADLLCNAITHPAFHLAFLTALAALLTKVEQEHPHLADAIEEVARALGNQLTHQIKTTKTKKQ